MSDLQCPATIYIARHGDADYHEPDILQDEGGWLTELGREQVANLAESLVAERVSSIYTSTLSRAIESGALLGERLEVRPISVDGLQEFSVGDFAGLPDSDKQWRNYYYDWLAGNLAARVPGGESGEEICARFHAALSEIADTHRGETVVVVSHGGVMSLAIPRYARGTQNDFAKDRFVPNAAAAKVRIDADGWVLDHWPGTASPHVV